MVGIKGIDLNSRPKLIHTDLNGQIIEPTYK